MLRWKRSRRVFVSSMGDLFHESVPDGVILEVLTVCATAAMIGKHIPILLTKRAQRMRSLLNRVQWWVGGIQLAKIGSLSTLLVKMPTLDRDTRTSVWTRAERGCPEGVHLGVSCCTQADVDSRVPELLATPASVRWVSLEPMLVPMFLGSYLTGGLLWVVTGCESGPDRRPCNPSWVRCIVDQCRMAGVPCFVKQLECYGHVSRDPYEWAADLRVQEYPR